MTFRIIRTAVISTVIDQVLFYDETLEHIKEEHPEVPIELPSIMEAVTNAVTNPTKIESSYGNSVIFFDQNTTNASGDALIVPVKIVDGTSGRVKTVYFASSAARREVLWDVSWPT
jgi:hypothetical protein